MPADPPPDGRGSEPEPLPRAHIPSPRPAPGAPHEGTPRESAPFGRLSNPPARPLAAEPLHFCAHVDTIRRDDDGRVRFHYTILDFAAHWVAGEPVAASDVSAAVWAPMADLESYGLWSEAHRIIGIARTLVA